MKYDELSTEYIYKNSALDYIEFEIKWDKINISETLEYYLDDDITKEEFWLFIKKCQDLYEKMS